MGQGREFGAKGGVGREGIEDECAEYVWRRVGELTLLVDRRRAGLARLARAVLSFGSLLRRSSPSRTLLSIHPAALNARSALSLFAASCFRSSTPRSFWCLVFSHLLSPSPQQQPLQPSACADTASATVAALDVLFVERGGASYLVLRPASPVFGSDWLSRLRTRSSEVLCSRRAAFHRRSGLRSATPQKNDQNEARLSPTRPSAYQV